MACRYNGPDTLVENIFGRGFGMVIQPVPYPVKEVSLVLKIFASHHLSILHAFYVYPLDVSLIFFTVGKSLCFLPYQRAKLTPKSHPLDRTAQCFVANSYRCHMYIKPCCYLSVKRKSNRTERNPGRVPLRPGFLFCTVMSVCVLFVRCVLLWYVLGDLYDMWFNDRFEAITSFAGIVIDPQNIQ